jgi:hypothetical protein
MSDCISEWMSDGGGVGRSIGFALREINRRKSVSLCPSGRQSNIDNEQGANHESIRSGLSKVSMAIAHGSRRHIVCMGEDCDHATVRDKPLIRDRSIRQKRMVMMGPTSASEG